MGTSALKKVFVGLSGGVDSSVAAKRLIDAGYAVTGVFIKTWQPDFLVCNWEKERLDAMRVAAQLGIPFLTCDAEEAYRVGVGEYMIAEYTAGRTPNPDALCNQKVKFGAFLQFALEHGADFVATGHYARVEQTDGLFKLLRGLDTEKDQSYFLWTLTQEQLSRTLFPVGDTLKPVLRKEAEQAALITAQKHDSQGVCFLGAIDMPEFLSHYITPQAGSVLDTQGNTIGTHTGAHFYTIGQRHGFTLTEQGTRETPHYVIVKDIAANTITVASEPITTATARITLSHTNWIQGVMPSTGQAQFRYRQTPFEIELSEECGEILVTILTQNIELPSSGQSCVLYNGDACLGGGIIEVTQA
jgi:tRNA-specific 2-thiouridylase